MNWQCFAHFQMYRLSYRYRVFSEFRTFLYSTKNTFERYFYRFEEFVSISPCFFFNNVLIVFLEPFDSRRHGLDWHARFKWNTLLGSWILSSGSLIIIIKIRHVSYYYINVFYIFYLFYVIICEFLYFCFLFIL